MLDIRKFKLDIKLSFRLMSGDTHLEKSRLGCDLVWVLSSLHGT